MFSVISLARADFWYDNLGLWHGKPSPDQIEIGNLDLYCELDKNEHLGYGTPEEDFSVRCMASQVHNNSGNQGL